MLDPNVLTIGFARRFATYKRADLIMTDLDRLDKLVNDPRPADPDHLRRQGPSGRRAGQAADQEDRQPARHDQRFANRIVFVEDYDINVCRHLVQGVDVWLNNPRRPLEASGTSGQKAVLNGGAEPLGPRRLVGRSLRRHQRLRHRQGHEPRSDEHHRRPRRRVALTTCSSEEVIPLYYERDVDGLPRHWIQRMMNSISSLAWRFSAHRMVVDYVRSGLSAGRRRPELRYEHGDFRIGDLGICGFSDAIPQAAGFTLHILPLSALRPPLTPKSPNPKSLIPFCHERSRDYRTSAAGQFLPRHRATAVERCAAAGTRSFATTSTRSVSTRCCRTPRSPRARRWTLSSAALRRGGRGRRLYRGASELVGPAAGDAQGLDRPRAAPGRGLRVRPRRRGRIVAGQVGRWCSPPPTRPATPNWGCSATPWKTSGRIASSASAA